VRLDDAVAVVAEHTGAARKGLAALKLSWRAGPNAAVSTPELVRSADAALERAGVVAKNEGEVERAESAAATVFEATYRMPMLAHAALEPMNCTVHVRPDACEVWVGTQVAVRAQQTAADVTGLPLEKVTLHNLQIGGGFGRRLDADGVTLAVRVARQVEGPVKVTWSREEDIRHDNFRYINHSRVRIGLDREGKAVSWNHRVVAPAVMARWLPAFFQNGVDYDAVGGAESPYDIANVRVDFVRNEAPPGFLSGNWRGVGGTRNAVPVESAIDEVAHASGADPVAYRRALLGKSPRLRAALDLAASQAGWGAPLPARSGRGVALLHDFGSYCALIAELSVGDDGRVRVSRFVCALDCGEVVNPDTVKAQVEGGVIFGLSAALYGKITVVNGRVVESNFDSQPVVRMNETPRIDVHLIESHEAPGGVGEVGTCPVAPAMLNAIFAATGTRLRDLPIDRALLRKG
jgi:isoquinoline 1-oxidoreductase beta subunit